MVRFVIYRGSVPAGNYPNVKGASIQKPKPTVDTSERSRDRFVLRNAWNTNTLNRTGTVTIGGVTSELKSGPFRAVNNAGDPLSRKNYSCGGSNMITSRPGVMILTTKDGGQDKSNCDVLIGVIVKPVGIPGTPNVCPLAVILYCEVPNAFCAETR